MADEDQQTEQPGDGDAEDDQGGGAPSTSSYEDDETSTEAEVDPDSEAGKPPTADEDADRPIAWRPGRRHGRSAEPRRRNGD